MIENIKFIKSLQCPHCKSFASHASSFYGDIIDVYCNCERMSFCHYTRNNDYLLFLNLKGNYQLQIHAGINHLIFEFVEFPESDVEIDIDDCIHLNINFIPEHLDWQDPEKLVEQLEFLTTFQ